MYLWSGSECRAAYIQALDDFLKAGADPERSVRDRWDWIEMALWKTRNIQICSEPLPVLTWFCAAFEGISEQDLSGRRNLLIPVIRKLAVHRRFSDDSKERFKIWFEQPSTCLVLGKWI